MFIKKQNNKETTANKNIGSLFVLILIICLLVIIIINFFQLIDLIENIKVLNEKLKTLSNNYASLSELKTTYIIQLVKSIFVLIAEISGLIICRFINDIILKTK